MIRSRSQGDIAPVTEWLAGTRPDGPGGGGKPHENFARYGTYKLSAFAGDEQGNLLVDDVFRLEDIDTLSDALRHHGLPIPADRSMPHFNFTRGNVDYRRIYTTKESIELS